MKWFCVSMLLFLFLDVKESRSDEAPVVYAVHIGINMPPKDSNLPTLRYADDDALRMFRFMSRFSKRSVLATVLDVATQHQADAPQTVLPKQQNLETIFHTLDQTIRADKEKGRNVILHMTYSGHGERVDNGVRLVLLDGYIDRAWLEKHVLGIPADAIHLILDACHAEGIVGERGIVKAEVDATARPLSEATLETVVRGNLLDRYPNVGALVAASVDQESYEWSFFNSGVFTHELLSAFAGAADVNEDGDIAYSEAAAFVSSANRAVKYQKAKPRIASYPPKINRNTPIMSVRWINKPTIFEGDAETLSRFYIETDQGRRVLDAHAETGMHLKLLVPPKRRLWVSRGNQSAVFQATEGETVHASSLEFVNSQLAARGSLDSAFKKGLFVTAFGPAYYSGWVDNAEEVSVEFAEKSDRKAVGNISLPTTKIAIHSVSGTFSTSEVDHEKGLVVPVALLICGGLTLASGGVTLGFAIDAKKAFDGTDIERNAAAENDRFTRFGRISIGLGVVAAAFSAAGAVLFGRKKKKLRAFGMISGGGILLGTAFAM